MGGCARVSMIVFVRLCVSMFLFVYLFVYLLVCLCVGVGVGVGVGVASRPLFLFLLLCLLGPFFLFFSILRKSIINVVDRYFFFARFLLK